MRPDLEPPHQQPAFHGLRIPHEFYWVLRDPAPLAGMVLPQSPWPDWDGLRTSGFRWIVCLCSDHPRYDPFPLEHLARVELTDLVEGGEPDDPQLEEKGIRILGKLVHEKLLAGEGVIVHCAGGRGRTGTVLGVVLRRFGFSAREVVDYLDEIHLAREKAGWPEASWQREVVER
ncbi:MAG: tyrosine-protein phosphatase [Akkermansiaceae bacterium]|nr:tyrosine-protein phosphatase [Akkermansiaceae bacterium]MCP5549566.1 tyrosine-protein phosphatase [Akkermansiaceae bacterium]